MDQMNFSFPVNSILKDEVTKVFPSSLGAEEYPGRKSNQQEHIKKLIFMIDEIGKRSSAAQGLNNIITSANKLRAAEDQIVYLLKDTEANNGYGELIGILKLGIKSLYLYSPSGQVLQVHPWCILDFYISEPYQRKGNGNMLMHYMINDLNIEPKHLAIDNPSIKLTNFMKKNFHFVNPIMQSNKFVIDSSFFEDLPNNYFKQIDQNRRNFDKKMTLNHINHNIRAAAGQFGSERSMDSAGMVIHGGSDTIGNGHTHRYNYVN